MNDVRLVRENGLFNKSYFWLDYKGVCKQIAYEDFWGDCPKYYMLSPIRGTEYARYVENINCYPNVRMDKTGLTRKEVTDLMCAYNTRRYDKKALDAQKDFSAFRQANIVKCDSFYLVAQEAMKERYLELMNAADRTLLDKIHQASTGSPAYRYKVIKWVIAFVCSVISPRSTIIYFYHMFVNWWFRDQFMLNSYKHMCDGVEMGSDDPVVVRPGSNLKKWFLRWLPKNRSLKSLFPHFSFNMYLANNSFGNMVRGLAKRQMAYKSEVSVLAMRRFQTFSYRWIKNNVKAISGKLTSYPDWLASRVMPSYKKEMYDHEHQGYSANSPARDCFIKNENIVTSITRDFLDFFKTDKAPRNISAACSDIQTCYGPFMYDAKKELVRQTNNLFNIDERRVHYAVGMSGKDLGNLVTAICETMVTPCFLGADFSKFDSTVSSGHMKVEEAMYLQLFPKRYHREIRSYMRRCRQAMKITARCENYEIKAVIPASRGSGDPNTTIGNCIVNAMLWNWAFYEHGIEKTHVLVCGDDVFLIGPRDELEELKSKVDFSCLGMKVEYEDIQSTIEKSTFLSGYFLPGLYEGKPALIHTPKLSSIFGKTMVTNKCWNTTKDLLKLKHAKTQSVVDMLWFRPVLRQAALARLQRYDQVVAPSEIPPSWYGHWSFYNKGLKYEATEATFQALANRYEGYCDEPFLELLVNSDPGLSPEAPGCLAVDF